MSADRFPFQLKLQDRDGFVHPHIQFQIPGIVIVIILDGKDTAIRLCIRLQGKGRQRYQIDTVAFLQRIQIAVACGIADHGRDTGHIPRSGAHPDHIVIAPLDIQRMVMHQRIHDDMRSLPAIIDIADDMQMIHDHSLDQFAQFDDKLRRASDIDDRMDDLVVVTFLIFQLLFFGDQLLDDIGKILRQCSSHLGSGVLGGHSGQHPYETVQCDLVPVFQKLLFLFHDRQLFLRIIDQCR